jgi:hypothetical protein
LEIRYLARQLIEPEVVTPNKKSMAGTPKKTARKATLSNPATIDKVCNLVVEGKTFDFIAKSLELWPSQLWNWLKESPERREKFGRARELQAQRWAEECIPIADDDSNDILTNSKGDPIPNHAKIQRDKLRIDSRKWAASKLDPKAWGDRQEVSVTFGTLEDALGTLKLPVGEPIDIQADIQQSDASSPSDAQDELAALCGKVPEAADDIR